MSIIVKLIIIINKILEKYSTNSTKIWNLERKLHQRYFENIINSLLFFQMQYFHQEEDIICYFSQDLLFKKWNLC